MQKKKNKPPVSITYIGLDMHNLQLVNKNNLMYEFDNMHVNI